MTNLHGSPIWYELMTNAPDQAEAFYTQVMNWSFAVSPDGSKDGYRAFTAVDGEGVGGVMSTPGPAAIWAVYFSVTDVDTAAARVRDLGGHVHLGPRDIPGVGRFAFVADPQGATFYLMRGADNAASTAFAPARTGHCSWNELVTSDQNAALAFYTALFGWKKAGAMPMDAMGDYTFIGHQDQMIGAMMNSPQPGTAPFWNFAFTIPDIDRAAQQVQAAGGTIRLGPVALPGDQGDWMIQIDDPHGARVMFTGKRIQEAT